jgi:putative transcriptional regulator
MPVRLRLKEILEERGMSQRELARIMNIRPTTISDLCSGNVKGVYFDTLDRICEALQIELSDLILRDKD